MFHRIMIPLDGTPFAESALPWVRTLVAPTGTLELVHVHNAPSPMLMEGVILSDPALDETVRTNEVHYLDEVADRVRKLEPRITIVGRNVDSLEPLADVLAEALDGHRTELVVMTTHARGPFARMLLGSVSDEFLRRSPVPVLLIHGDESNPTASPGVDRWIVPLDGSPLSETIVKPMTKLALTTSAGVTLLGVASSFAGPVNPEEMPLSLNPITPTKQAEQYLDRLQGDLKEQGLTVNTKVIPEGSVIEAVQKEVARDPRVGVALATHGRSGIERWFAGSVTDRVIRAIPGPVLVYHPPI